MDLDHASFVLLFLPLCLLAVELVRRWLPRSVPEVLLLASVVYYWLASPGTFTFMAVLLAGNAVSVVLLRRWPQLLPALVVVAILPQVTWKYLLGWDTPLGLSIVTFLNLSILLDVRSGAPVLNAARRMLYSLFFATVTAGPISRFKDFSAQLGRLGAGVAGRGEVLRGGSLLVFGLAKVALLGRPLQSIVESVVAAAESGITPNVLESAYAMWGSLLAMYFIFSGYSDVAIGIGMALGLSLPPNFNSPLKAASTAQFYERWHMSLSMWVKLYVFAPIVRKIMSMRAGTAAQRGRWAWSVATVASLTLIGAWHGDSLLVLGAGALGGLIVVADTLMSRKSRNTLAATHFFRQGSLLVVLSIFALAFSTGDLVAYQTILGSWASPLGYVLPEDLMPHVETGTLTAVCRLLACSAVALCAPNTMQIFGLLPGVAPRYSWVAGSRWGALTGVTAIITGIVLSSSAGQGFIYDAF